MSAPGFDELPPPAKLGLGGTALAVIGFMGYLINGHPGAAIILLVGLVLVVLLVIAWGKLGAVKQKSKGKVFSSDLSAQLRATPQGVTGADSRAKLDDLRRKLQEGFDKLSATGKSPYILPWYLMVGEPGSGKTKALAAANIALPGFQDPLQGTGGTVNMNWWFTNNGIILDTAGRLMLPEVPTSNNAEWDEFLRTLNKKRPDCPINGLLLAIPADTLITDSEEKIYRKAGEIAVQFNKVQAMLGIRFPVFVLITKCDKILGFREYFESLSSPEEQAQMLGWSNPEKLDDAFRPELVEQHLQNLHEQLIRRRLRLIQDPVNTEDPSSRRLDQVDALYELPDALLAIAPRLRRYLEPIFVAGPLSSKPLFLRGIYFTSSLQTGEAVDKAISAIMGVDIVSAHGGPVVGEKPYFLRHVFQEKVFKEKGLVTRTDNVAQYKRRRKLSVMAAGFASVFALIGLSWLGKTQLNQRIEAPTQFWKGVADARKEEHAPLNVIGEDGLYRGQTPIDKLQLPLVKVHQQALEQDEKLIKVPPVFSLVATSSSFDPNAQRRVAYRDLYESTVVQPLVSRAEDQIIRETSWSPAATTALRQLMLIEAGAKLDSIHYSDNIVPITPLANYVLSKEDQQKFADNRDTWEDGFKWLYLSDKNRFDWPPKTPDPKREEAIRAGVRKFENYVKRQAGDAAERRRIFTQIADFLDQINNAEDVILATITDPSTTFKANAGALNQWQLAAKSLHESSDKLDKALAALKDWNGQGTPGLASYYQAALNNDQKTIQAQYDYLINGVLDQLPSNSNSILVSVAKDLSKERADTGSLGEKPEVKQAQDRIGKLEQVYLPTNANGKRYYHIHDDMVQLTTSLIPAELSAPQALNSDFTALIKSLHSLDEKDVDLRKALDDQAQPFIDIKARERRLATTVKTTLDTAMALQRNQAIEAVFRKLPESKDDWHFQIKQKIVNGVGEPPKLALPLTDIDGADYFPDPGYEPNQFELANGFFEQLRQYCGFSDKEARDPTAKAILDFKALSDQFQEKYLTWQGYQKSFEQYWKTDIVEKMKPRSDYSWDKIEEVLAKVDSKTIDQSLAIIEAQAIRAHAVTNPTTDMEKLDKDANSCLIKWRDLSPSDSSQGDRDKLILNARDLLLGYNADDFGPEYLLYHETPKFAEVYWENVFVAAFKALAAECAKNARTAGDELLNLKRFPLSEKDDVSGLSLNQIKKAQQLINTLTPVQEPSANQNSLLSRRSRYDSLGITKAINEMVGSEALKVVDPKWIAEVRPLINALANDQLKCELTVVPVGRTETRDNRQSVRQNWRLVSMQVAGIGQLFPPLPIDEDVKEKRDASLPSMQKAMGKDLQLLLYQTDNAGEKPETFTISGGNWPYLRMIMADKSRKVELSDAGPMQFDITYFVKDAYFIPLKVSFKAPGLPGFKLPSWFNNSK